MMYTLKNILDEASSLTDLQEDSLETTLKNTDDTSNDPQIIELLAFIREDDYAMTSYTHG